MTGTVDDMILYRNKSGTKLYARKTFTLKGHPSHAPFRSAQQAIYALQPSEGFKQNLRDYLIAYNRLPENQDREAHAWNNLYNKLMFAMQRTMGIPLASP